MRKNYDFSQSTKNPYAKHLKKPVTIRLDLKVVQYFKALSGEMGVPYQQLINLYLKDCADKERKPLLKWLT